MILGKVIGTVVADQIYEGLEGIKLLVVQPLDHHQEASGRAVVAVDTVQAGPEELVYLAQSREAALSLEHWFVPVDHAIVGIVDQLDVAP
ncbi:MAG: EutN/CcmL family microcompartment protein [Deltaproteobacteria bacterium]|nr:EutN/CcmL family microcompartment protein [Deltaproteobacteria bacterium]